MATNEDAPAEQVLIIRRKSGGEDECHHGGVWKIAYADFMTAMMAFFLVMWLINASNTDTKAKVASYFNPIKLMDSSAKKKGLQNIEDKTKPAEKAGSASGSGEDQAKSAPTPGINENAIQDRKAQIESKSAWGTKLETKDKESRAAEQKGRAFRDPFNPLAPSSMRSKERAEAAKQASADAVDGQATSGQGDVAAKFGLGVKAAAPAAVTPSTETPGQPSQAGPPVVAGAGSSGAKPPAAAIPAEKSEKIDPEVSRNTIAASRVLRDVQAAAKQIGLTGGPGIDVMVEPDGVVLSLTDTGTFGMFGIGSADANIELVALLQKIVPILTANSQRIIVRGHTDARPFKNEKNSNWKLSMSRAEAASLILTRSGIDDKRIERIEAHADRKLKLANSPEAAANRRIEILLRPSSVP